MLYPVKKTNGVVYADPFAQIFEQFFGDTSRCRSAETKLATQFDVIETEDRYVVAADLPGLGKNEIEVIVADDVLTIRGEKKTEKNQEDKSYLFSERSYGKFERTFRLPDTVEQATITAQVENGVLTLELPKKPEAKHPEPRKITVK